MEQKSDAVFNLKSLKKLLGSSRPEDKEEALDDLVTATHYSLKHNRIPVCKLGIVPILLKMIWKKKELGEFTIVSLEVLVNLSVEPENRASITKDGALPVLAKVLQASQSEDPTATEATTLALKILVNLSIESSELRLQIVKSNILPLIGFVMDHQRDSAMQWAIWVTTNLALEKELTQALIDSSFLKAIPKVAVRGNSTDARTKGFTLFRNLAAHEAAAEYIVNSGMVEESLGALTLNDLSEVGVSCGESALLTLLRLAEHKKTRSALIEKKVPEQLTQLSRQPTFHGMVAIMTMAYLLGVSKETYSILTAPGGTVGMICSLVEFTGQGKGIPNLCEVSIFELKTILGATLLLCRVPANRQIMGKTHLLNACIEIAKTTRRLVILERSLAIAVEIAERQQFGLDVLTDESVISFLNQLLKSTKEDKKRIRTLCERLLVVSERLDVPRGEPCVILDCDGVGSHGFVCVGKGETLSVKALKKWDPVTVYIKTDDGVASLVAALAHEAALVKARHVVIGVGGWYRQLPKTKRANVRSFLQEVKAKMESIHVAPLFLSWEDEVRLRVSGIDFASRIANSTTPYMSIGDVGDGIYFVSGRWSGVIGEPKQQTGTQLLLEKGIDGITKLEELWDTAEKNFLQYNIQMRSQPIPILVCCDWSQVAEQSGISLDTPHPTVFVVDKLALTMEQLICKYGGIESLEMTETDASLLTSVMAQLTVFDALIHPNSTITFSKTINVNQISFNGSWVAGWYLAN